MSTQTENPDTALVWFRRDLRLTDNPALCHALKNHQKAILLYIYAPEEEAPWQPGGASLWWLQKSLLALQMQIKALGGELAILRGESEQLLTELIEKHSVNAVYWNRLYDAKIVERDQQLKTKLKDNGLEVKSFSSYLLIEPWEIATQQGNPYQVYTPFSRLVRSKLAQLTPPLSKPEHLQQALVIEHDNAVNNLESMPWLEPVPKSQPWYGCLDSYWQPGEQSAVDRIKQFLAEKVTNYAAGRDIPAKLAATSRLSPHLHYGEITPKQIWFSIHAESADNAGGSATDDGSLSESVEKFVQQVIWRDFSHHNLFHSPKLDFEPKQSKFLRMTWADDPDGEKLERWQKGQTGIPIIDAGMRELWQTGIMHNRVRMLVASFLTKNLRLHWHKGASWFWDTLVDASLANNSQGWQWTAGCGTDAAPFFRIFNPVTQSERFDPQALYIDQYVPELAALPVKYRFAPWTAPTQTLEMAGIVLGRDYPKPMVDLKESRADALIAFKKLADNA